MMKQRAANTAPAAMPCFCISYGFNTVKGTCSQYNAMANAMMNDVIDPILNDVCESSLADAIDSM